MSGLTEILKFKAPVDDHLHTYLQAKRDMLSSVNQWGDDVVERLLPFVSAGKTLRGSLAAYTFSRFYPSVPPFVIDAAAALELIQSGLLIHDDIMDQDAFRRGKPSMYKQYDAASGETISLLGISMAINVADLCFFLAYELLPPSVTKLVSMELQAVVLAQMQDVAGGYSRTRFTEDDILSIYRYKTARYTFSLSMSVGALLAGASTPTVTKLQELGEHMGLVFQIRDDELNVSGAADKTGKPTGSDATNDKQTLLAKVGAEKIKVYKTTHIDASKRLIETLPFSATHKIELTHLLEYLITRDK